MGAEEQTVNTFMLLSSMMMTNKTKHTNTSLATAAKIVLTIEPVWFRTWFRMGQSFFVLTVTVGSKRKTE